VRIDLHSHTSASDGELSPLALLELQAAQGTTLTAFTDHDTLAGWHEAMAGGERSAHLPRLLAGIELSSCSGSREIHVVGLGFDPYHPELEAAVASQRERRSQRAARIAQRFEYLGIRGALEAAQLLAGGNIPGRPHFARFLVDSGRVRSNDEAFHRYLGQGKPAACRIDWPSMQQAVGWIREAGGRAVLAHPLAYGMTGKRLRALVGEFRECGGDALEVALPGLSVQHMSGLVALAQEAGLRASAGSDIHAATGWRMPARIPALPQGIEPIWSDWI
jgi:3',5'-nucleoside bisphosphate phosphatase